MLILESTYGDRLHEDRSTRRQRLVRVVEHALANNGTVLIPAFSVGRTQEPTVFHPFLTNGQVG